MVKRLRDIYQIILNNLPTTSVGQLPQNLEHVTDRRLAAANKHIQGPGASNTKIFQPHSKLLDTIILDIENSGCE